MVAPQRQAAGEAVAAIVRPMDPQQDRHRHHAEQLHRTAHEVHVRQQGEDGVGQVECEEQRDMDAQQDVHEARRQALRFARIVCHGARPPGTRGAAGTGSGIARRGGGARSPRPGPPRCATPWRPRHSGRRCAPVRPRPGPPAARGPTPGSARGRPPVRAGRAAGRSRPYRPGCGGRRRHRWRPRARRRPWPRPGRWGSPPRRRTGRRRRTLGRPAPCPCARPPRPAAPRARGARPRRAGTGGRRPARRRRRRSAACGCSVPRAAAAARKVGWSFTGTRRPTIPTTVAPGGQPSSARTASRQPGSGRKPSTSMPLGMTSAKRAR